MTSIKEQLKTLFTEHDYNKIYKKDDIVTHTIGENINFYLAKQNVPRFVSIHSKGYWKLINTIEAKEQPQPTPTPTPTEDVDYLCFTANKAEATLRMIGAYTEDYTGDDFALEYSTDGETWQDWNFTKGTAEGGMIPCVSDTLTFVAIGDKVYLRGDNTNGTSDINLFVSGSGFYFTFEGGEDTQPEDNEFSVTGDLQTIKDKTGNDKTAGCYYGLFSGTKEEPSVLITTAPDLTATILTDYCYADLFMGQVLLQNPADLSHIDVNSNNIFEFIEMYIYCMFDMTSDNGVTLNGFNNIEYPIDISSHEIFINNNYNFAQFLGNTNGFDIATVDLTHTDGGSVSSDENLYLIPTNENVTATLTATPNSGYRFIKWQQSSDGETYTDIQGATNTTLQVTLTQAGNYYYKAVFEASTMYTVTIHSVIEIHSSPDDFQGNVDIIEYINPASGWSFLDANIISQSLPENTILTIKFNSSYESYEQVQEEEWEEPQWTLVEYHLTGVQDYDENTYELNNNGEVVITISEDINELYAIYE